MPALYRSWFEKRIAFGDLHLSRKINDTRILFVEAFEKDKLTFLEKELDDIGVRLNDYCTMGKEDYNYLKWKIMDKRYFFR